MTSGVVSGATRTSPSCAPKSWGYLRPGAAGEGREERKGKGKRDDPQQKTQWEAPRYRHPGALATRDARRASLRRAPAGLR